MTKKIFEKTFFNEPKQVRFLDFDGCDIEYREWKGGIAVGENIICGCCGGVIDQAELFYDWKDWAKDEFQDVETPLEVYECWSCISEEIKGN